MVAKLQQRILQSNLGLQFIFFLLSSLEKKLNFYSKRKRSAELSAKSTKGMYLCGNSRHLPAGSASNKRKLDIFNISYAKSNFPAFSKMSDLPSPLMLYSCYLKETHINTQETPTTTRCCKAVQRQKLELWSCSIQGAELRWRNIKGNVFRPMVLAPLMRSALFAILER